MQEHSPWASPFPFGAFDTTPLAPLAALGSSSELMMFPIVSKVSEQMLCVCVCFLCACGFACVNCRGNEGCQDELRETGGARERERERESEGSCLGTLSFVHPVSPILLICKQIHGNGAEQRSLL